MRHFKPQHVTILQCVSAALLFFVAGIYGILVVAPEYFYETRYGQDYPPLITHPEYFYGFVGVCLVFQMLFLVIASDPIRFRPMMLLGVLEKLSFSIPAIILFCQSRLNALVTTFAVSDLVWAILFVVAYTRSRHRP